MGDSWDKGKDLLHVDIVEQYQKFLLFIVGQLLVGLRISFLIFRVFYFIPGIGVNVIADHLLAFDVGNVELFQVLQVCDNSDNLVEGKLC